MKLLIILLILCGCYTDSATPEPPDECTGYKWRCYQNVAQFCKNGNWTNDLDCTPTTQECSTKECDYNNTGCCIDIE